VAIWKGDGQADEDLIQSADRALYQAKDDGKNCCVLAP
jgi:PleD family two-component response regulator